MPLRKNDTAHVEITAFAAIGPDTYRERRQRVMESLDGGVALLYGAEGEEPLIQESTFYYLTGVSDPGAALLLMPGEKRSTTWVA